MAMDDFERDDLGRVKAEALCGYAVGTEAPTGVLLKFEYFEDFDAQLARQREQITLRVDRSHARQLAEAILKVVGDPDMPLPRGNA